MSKPGEHKTVQARILKYAQEIGWTYVPRDEAERRRGFDPDGTSPEERARKASLFFGDLLHTQVRAFNPKYKEAEGALIGEFQRFHADIYGNRDFLQALRNQHKFFCAEENRELDLALIDYGDLSRPREQWRNVYEVTEEFYTHNGKCGTREDVVFLINGIPVLVIECKNASKDEAIALGVDQIRRYHAETPEVMVPQMIFTATEAIGFAYGVTWNTVRRNLFNWKVTEGGFSNPPSPMPPSSIPKQDEQTIPPAFLNPLAQIDRHEHRLPHWQQGEVFCFVTWRLADSLPSEKLAQWQAEREAWLRQHPEPWDEAAENEYHERFSRQIDGWLDQGSGSGVLRDPALARVVAEALRHFDQDRYNLVSFVVMPNHVHVVFKPRTPHRLEDIVKSWKGFTAREINRRLGRTGPLWQADYWDRLIRNERHFVKCVEYIRENPVKAKLRADGFVLFEKEDGFANPASSSQAEGGQECPPSVVECPPSVGIGNLEAKVKSFCAVPRLLRFLKDFILFAEKEEELQKFILHQHQTGGVDKVVARALDPKRTRGLVWHTQGSGKTYTMIVAAQLLFRAPQADKPTILLMIDRNELEDQMLKNLASVGLGNVAHAHSIVELNRLLKADYRGIIVTMIHKFRDMPANLNLRTNIYVFIDEAHRTTGGDLGNFLMAGLPNATFIGFTGTPVDKTVYGKGTFKTFGCEDDQGYLHKYSISESIEDGTTLPLYYNLAPNDMLVPHEIMEKEFLALAETEGIADIEELNKILERAVSLKNFLKGKERVKQVAGMVADHFRENVEPLGYKAFLVAVDREACTFYKEALDAILPPEYSEIVFTGNNNDPPHLKKWHLDPKREKQIRKNFIKVGEQPKILIVTEKLLTGFDAPILYAMYLDKPMRDHTLLQAIARVNRPYENEAAEMVKPHGFVLDFVGIFDKLEKALAFDSDEINAIVKDIGLLKHLFKAKMESKAPAYLALVTKGFNDKDVDNLIEHFRDKERRKEFFKEYKEVEMLYEIISPDAFLRPFIAPYTTLASIYAVVRNAYAKKVYVDKAFQKKTNDLVQRHIGASMNEVSSKYVVIDRSTIATIKAGPGSKAIKVINLVKAIEKTAEENGDDPFLVALTDRAKAVQESFENRQTSTADALAKLMQEIEKDEQRKKEQAAKGLDGLTYFVLCKLTDDGILNPEPVSKKVREAFARFPNWQGSEAELRELRKQVTFAIFAEEDNLEKVTATVEALFFLLQKSFRP
ncbi:MAG: HsdR family type I site-specific deoxyribonuclease [Verrucomicrobia bacterium]|nr:HsdR family type I site-specific deoxyribonuclease [Verrucomicrobiota bacterium]